MLEELLTINLIKRLVEIMKNLSFEILSEALETLSVSTNLQIGSVTLKPLYYTQRIYRL